jgi:hypothetical protein
MHHEYEQNERDHTRTPFEVDVSFCQVCMVSEAGIVAIGFDSGG